MEENKGSFFDIVKTVAIALVLTYVILTFVRISVVNGDSMNPTLVNGQRLICHRTAYKDEKPEYKDIVIVETPYLEERFLIKRIIGTPGDKVEMIDNKLYVNGEKLKETYIKETMENNEDNYWNLKEDEYFICGDNRNNSLDSRIIGPVTIDQIYGKIIFDINNFKAVD